MKGQQCKMCANVSHIVNKRHQLCLSCNRNRLSKQTVVKPKKHGARRVSAVSRKGAEIQERLKETYALIDLTRERVCVGCGTTRNLSRAHILSRQKCHNLGKPELIYDKRNIAYLCLSIGESVGCHSIWDDGREDDKARLLCYDSFQEWLNFIHQSK